MYEATDLQTGDRVAVKCVERRYFKEMQMECDILKQVSHENVISLIDYFDDGGDIVHVVMELATGGDVCERLVQKCTEGKLFTEEVVSNIMRTAILAVIHLHSRGIAHLDLKPENFLFKDQSDQSVIKVSDFGFSKILHRNETIQDMAGTPQYIAPELVSRKPYDFSPDVWSIGVIMHVCLSGTFPFNDNDPVKIVKLLRSLRPGDNFPSLSTPVWDHISAEAKDLIRKLLQVDPQDRISLRNALEHPWFKGKAPSIPLTAAAEEMLVFNRKRKLKFSEFSLGSALVNLLRNGARGDEAARAAVLSLAREGEDLNATDLENIGLEKGLQPIFSIALSEIPELQREAASMLRTIASGELGAEEIAFHGGARYLTSILRSPSMEARLFTVETLLLMAEKGDSVIQALVTAKGLFPALLNLCPASTPFFERIDGQGAEVPELKDEQEGLNSMQLRIKTQNLLALMAARAPEESIRTSLHKPLCYNVIESAMVALAAGSSPSSPMRYMQCDSTTSCKEYQIAVQCLVELSTRREALWRVISAALLYHACASGLGGLPSSAGSSRAQTNAEVTTKCLLILSDVAMNSTVARMMTGKVHTTLLSMLAELQALEPGTQQFEIMCIIRVLACIEDALASSATKKSKKPATTPNKRKPSPLSFAAILQHLSSLVAASNPTAVAPEFSLALRWALAVTDTDADGATETPEYLKSNGHVRYLRTECGVEVWNWDWSKEAVTLWVHAGEEEHQQNEFSFEVQPISSGVMRAGFLREQVALARDPSSVSEALSQGVHLGQDDQGYSIEGNGCLYFEGRRLRKREARFVGLSNPGPVLGCVAHPKDFQYYLDGQAVCDQSRSSRRRSSEVSAPSFIAPTRGFFVPAISLAKEQQVEIRLGGASQPMRFGTQYGASSFVEVVPLRNSCTAAPPFEVKAGRRKQRPSSGRKRSAANMEGVGEVHSCSGAPSEPPEIKRPRRSSRGRPST